jgi:hypothetical protein
MSATHGHREQCTYMKSSMRATLRRDVAHFPDAAFFSGGGSWVGPCRLTL